MSRPEKWRDRAAAFRERAQTTREAERQRIFPVLAVKCEEIAAKLEASNQTRPPALPE